MSEENWDRQEELEAAQDRCANLLAANIVCRRDIEALMSSCDKLETQNAKLEAEVDRLNQQIGEATGRIETDGRLIIELEAENGTLNGQADRDKQTIIKLGFRIAELEAEVAKLEKQICL